MKKTTNPPPLPRPAPPPNSAADLAIVARNRGRRRSRNQEFRPRRGRDARGARKSTRGERYLRRGGLGRRKIGKTSVQARTRRAVRANRDGAIDRSETEGGRYTVCLVFLPSGPECESGFHCSFLVWVDSPSPSLPLPSFPSTSSLPLCPFLSLSPWLSVSHSRSSSLVRPPVRSLASFLSVDTFPSHF